MHTKISAQGELYQLPDEQQLLSTASKKEREVLEPLLRVHLEGKSLLEHAWLGDGLVVNLRVEALLKKLPQPPYEEEVEEAAHYRTTFQTV